MFECIKKMFRRRRMRAEGEKKKKKRIKCMNDRAEEDERDGGIGISSEQHWASTDHRDREVEGKGNAVDETFLELAGWLSDTCL